MNQGWRYQNRVRPDQAGQTVLELYQKYTHSTLGQWQERIELGQILLDGQRITPDTKLQAHQQLVYHRPPWEEPVVPLQFEILYQDQDLWVIDKPSGLPVLPGGKFLEHTVLGQLDLQFPDESLVPIHRLGRGTSGLLLLAKSKRARKHLSQQMRDRHIEKIYLALIPSGDYPNQFQIETPIGRLPYPTLGYVYGASASGKTAQSFCDVLQRNETTSIVSVRITTGRPHQIRIHLASYGYPLVGDPLYTVGGVPYEIQGDSAPIPSDCGYHLHAWRLKFLHPDQEQWLDLSSAPPPILELNAISH